MGPKTGFGRIFWALPRFGERVAHFLELKRPYFDPVLFTKFHGEHFGRVSFLGPKTGFGRIFWALPRFSGSSLDLGTHCALSRAQKTLL